VCKIRSQKKPLSDSDRRESYLGQSERRTKRA